MSLKVKVLHVILTCIVIIPINVNGIEEAICFADVRKEIKQLEFRDQPILDRPKLDLLKELPHIFSPKHNNSIKNANISEECREDMLVFLEGLESDADYALRMYYSNGQLPDIKALYNFYFRDFGNYELCVRVPEDSLDAVFKTKQCGLVFLLPVEIRTSYCVPVTCSNEDLKQITIQILVDYRIPWPKEGREYNNFVYQCIDEVPWEAGAIVTLCIVSIFLLLVIIGTTLEVIMGLTSQEDVRPVGLKYQQTKTTTYGSTDTSFEKKIETPHIGTMSANSGVSEKPMVEKETFLETSRKRTIYSVLLCFSVLTNGRKVLKVSSNSTKLDCLNGIRVLSMWWVILGHSASFIFPRIDNFGGVYRMAMNFSFMVIMNGTFSVDSFFVLSGLLITYLTLKHLHKSDGKMNWAMFYFHRFWRLTPFYMVVLAMHANLFAHIAKGQGFNELMQQEHENCANYWWTNLLYINNLYPFPGSINRQCIGWCWYLANDMQFFIISPFIIYLLHRRWKFGMSAICSLCLASFGATAYIATYWGLVVQGGANGQKNYNNRTQELPPGNDDLIYGKPYCRIPAYLVGMVVGFCLFKVHTKKYKLPMIFALLGWCAAIATGMAVIYGLWGTFKYEKQLNQGVAVFYTTVSRFAWSAAVGWVAFACSTGYGGYVNTLLSWKLWGPLGRMSYGAYLVHPDIVMTNIYIMKTSFHYTIPNLSYFFMSMVVLSYAYGFLMSLLVEGPFMGMEKVIFGKKKKE
ncbi:O-acyltransferase like protein-like [Antedon mediterranea]|uniref:O-acyltransferase like protein-like n=1 Tax=Antedon mediterranea TaxID=105859 RepID=UPI003AF4D49E